MTKIVETSEKQFRNARVSIDFKMKYLREFISNRDFNQTMENGLFMWIFSGESFLQNEVG